MDFVCDLPALDVIVYLNRAESQYFAKHQGQEYPLIIDVDDSDDESLAAALVRLSAANKLGCEKRADIWKLFETTSSQPQQPPSSDFSVDEILSLMESGFAEGQIVTMTITGPLYQRVGGEMIEVQKASVSITSKPLDLALQEGELKRKQEITEIEQRYEKTMRTGAERVKQEITRLTIDGDKQRKLLEMEIQELEVMLQDNQKDARKETESHIQQLQDETNHSIRDFTVQSEQRIAVLQRNADMERGKSYIRLEKLREHANAEKARSDREFSSEQDETRRQSDKRMEQTESLHRQLIEENRQNTQNYIEEVDRQARLKEAELEAKIRERRRN